MIPFVEVKRPDFERVRELLAPSVASGTWSNFGPVSLQLEEAVATMLELPPALRVVACASGAVALHGLVGLHEHLRGRPLRWVVSAYTFVAQRQGALAQARVVDCDAQGLLDLEALAELPDGSWDGLVVTSLFGSPERLEQYEDVARRAGKVVLFDSATCVGARYRGRPVGGFGDGEIFSFHHTKPCGFGEGGCVVVPAGATDAFRSLINFGLYKGIDTGGRSCNGKMSDVAAAFVLDRLRRREEIAAAQRQQFRRIAALAEGLGLDVLTRGGRDDAVPNLVPVLYARPVPAERFRGLPLVLHKYYRPLAETPRAADLYARVVCVPCHPGVAALADDALAGVLRSLAA